MLLSRLVDYAERLKGAPGDVRGPIAPSGYLKTPVKWLIPLDAQGAFRGPFIPTQGKGTRGKEYACPHRLRTSTSIRPKLLVDTAEYLLGVPKDDSEKKRTRARDCHAQFVELVSECANRTREPTVDAVRKFLEHMRFPPALPDGYDTSQLFTFQVDGLLPIDLPPVHDFWAEYFWDRVFGGEAGEEGESQAQDRLEGERPDNAAVELGAPTASSDMECVVCGRLSRPVPRHPFQIKGLPGRPAGAAIISANADAFESYGLSESLIAPTCKYCAEAYAKAANLLIEGESTRVIAGSCVYVFWTKEDRAFSPASLLSEPSPEEVKALIHSAWSAKRAALKLDETPFYASAFTANQGRVVVRDWLETTIADAKRSLGRWFALQQIVGDWGEHDPPPLPIKGYKRGSDKRWVEGLAECAVAKVKRRRDVKKASFLVPSALLHVALKGGPLPTWLLAEAIKRNTTERDVTRPRAALVKMVLLSQQPGFSKEDSMEQLDPSNRNPAYLCGRLMAVLEGVQRAALGDVGANVTARYFGTASSAPASVFGTLLRGAQHHLGRLRKEKRGTYEALERRLEEVTQGLPSFPKVLTLEGQGLFSLGYYHQRAADRAGAVAAKAAREKVPEETNHEMEGGTDD